MERAEETVDEKANKMRNASIFATTKFELNHVFTLPKRC